MSPDCLEKQKSLFKSQKYNLINLLKNSMYLPIVVNIHHQYHNKILKKSPFFSNDSDILHLFLLLSLKLTH